jgi:hypothetical protein
MMPPLLRFRLAPAAGGGRDEVQAVVAIDTSSLVTLTLSRVSTYQVLYEQYSSLDYSMLRLMSTLTYCTKKKNFVSGIFLWRNI